MNEVTPCYKLLQVPGVLSPAVFLPTFPSSPLDNLTRDYRIQREKIK